MDKWDDKIPKNTNPNREKESWENMTEEEKKRWDYMTGKEKPKDTDDYIKKKYEDREF